MTMHVAHDGPREAPPLLLIHGTGGSGAGWDPMVPVLAGHHHVIRVDLPGCGVSPPVSTYDVPDQAARVAAVLDDLGAGPVAVAGHSSGGWVATALAEQRPDLVRSLVMISSGPGVASIRPQPLILKALLGPPLGPLIWRVRSDAWIRGGIKSMTVRPVELPGDMVAAVRGISYRTMRKVQRKNGEYLAARDMPARLADLSVPVLVIFGAADPRYDPASARWYEAVPGARIEMLPGVGHVPLLEAPEATADLLLGFTAQNRP